MGFARYAYLCDREACSECSYPTCQHTTDQSHKLFKNVDEFLEMRLVGTLNNVDYYMEDYKQSFSKGEVNNK